jgi:hypothetical protein
MFDFATLLTLGLTAVSLALWAWLADRRRVRRKLMDEVGWMPWTPVFFVALMVAVIALGLAARAWLAG